MGLGGVVTFNRYGSRWRQLRKTIHADMQESRIPSYWPAQQEDARRLVVRLLNHNSSLLAEDIQQ